MRDLIFAIGAVLAFEGLLVALWPGLYARLAALAAETDPQSMRTVAVVIAAIGVALLWVARGFDAE